MNTHALNILKRFGLLASRIQKPSDAMLAQVYLVDDRYILRSRPFEKDTMERFAVECELCDHVAALTEFRFPQYLQSVSGHSYVIDNDLFWTLHEIIPGRPLGSWFELHRIDPSIHRTVLQTLHQLHRLTTGCLDEKFIDRRRLLGLIAPAMEEAPGFLSTRALDRLGLAYERVKNYCNTYPPEMGCFVHGDFHHGNILADNGRIIGFIDLDWCRVGSFYEDFAFSLMMMLRDYNEWSHEYPQPVYRSILENYGFEGDAELLIDHLILYALFDCTVFKYSTFENANAFFEYQKLFLESVCLEKPA